MSETDDRMERAERIRKMRESREPGDENDADEESGSGDDTEVDADVGDEPIEAGESTTDSATTTESGPTSNQSPIPDAGEMSTTDDGTTQDRQQASETGAATAVPDDSPSGGIAPLGGSSGFSLPGQSEMDAAAGTGADADEATTGAARARGGTGVAATEPSVRVLEFTVGEQVYCIDIERVEEIVKRETVTRVPNTDEYVEGVVDLRGQITTILDTRRLLDVDDDGPENLLVIFAPDGFEEHGTVGWVVDEVRQVVPVVDSSVRSAPSDEDHVRGIVDREDEDDLVVWIRPGEAMSRAVAVDGGE